MAVNFKMKHITAEKFISHEDRKLHIFIKYNDGSKDFFHTFKKATKEKVVKGYLETKTLPQWDADWLPDSTPCSKMVLLSRLEKWLSETGNNGTLAIITVGAYSDGDCFQDEVFKLLDNLRK